jgi:curved DNA-binding protein CbpA
MDLERCYEVLEIERNASAEEIRRAYKDIVNVWHPDRFANNPRLREKAEKKLKEINTAYEALNSMLSAGSPERSAGTAEGGDHSKDRRPEKGVVATEARDSAEAIAEAGTRIVLTLWSYLSSRVRQVFDNQVFAPEAEEGPKKDATRPWGTGGGMPPRGREQAGVRGRGKACGRGGGRRRGRGRGP